MIYTEKMLERELERRMERVELNAYYDRRFKYMEDTISRLERRVSILETAKEPRYPTQNCTMPQEMRVKHE